MIDWISFISLHNKIISIFLVHCTFLWTIVSEVIRWNFCMLGFLSGIYLWIIGNMGNSCHSSDTLPRRWLSSTDLPVFWGRMVISLLKTRISWHLLPISLFFHRIFFSWATLVKNIVVSHKRYPSFYHQSGPQHKSTIRNHKFLGSPILSVSYQNQHNVLRFQISMEHFLFVDIVCHFQ